jgi:hypothetical protein
MNLNTCHGVGSTSTANGQMLVTNLIDSNQMTRQTTGKSNLPRSELRVTHRQARLGDIVGVLMT